MELYHGSLEIVKSPEIRIPDRTLDYGMGFYLTSSFEQAAAWVRRKLSKRGSFGYVNVYDYDEATESTLNVLNFAQADEDWLDFVMNNRMDRDFRHDFDIVKGPVANDRVYASFALYEAGLLGKQELISTLKAYKLVNQVLLHTSKSLSVIQWKEAKEVNND